MVFIKVVGNYKLKKNKNNLLIYKFNEGFKIKKQLINIKINLLSKKKLNLIFFLIKLNLIFIKKKIKFNFFFDNKFIYNKNIYFQIFIKYFENKPLFIY